MNVAIKRIIGIFFINVILIGLGMMVLELIFGNWIRPNNLNQLNIKKSITIRYNIKGLYSSPFTETIYIRDTYGLRGKFDKPSEIDILTVGGSTTDQRYITEGETWQDVIQQRFHSIGKKVVVGNAGIDGQSTVGHIKNFDWWFPEILGLRPKYILFYVGLNDFYKDEAYDALLIRENNHSIRRLLMEKSAMYHVARTLYGIYQAEVKHKIGHAALDFSTIEWTNRPLQNSYDELMKTRLKEYAERLNILITKTRKFGSIPIFVTQPSRHYRIKEGILEGIGNEGSYGDVQINGVDHYYMMRKLDSITISVCREYDVPYIDMAKETVWEDDDFYDLTHMTPKGARKVGIYLFERLKDRF